MNNFLKRIPLFSDLPEQDLDQLCDVIQEVRLSAGEELFAQGSTGDMAYVIRDGELEILREAEGRKVLLAVRKVGEVIGEMSLLHEAPRMASVRARTDTLLLALSQEHFDELLNTSTSAARAMLHTITTRLRATESMLRQSEKIAQLGTLTAGVAHELNNPAAAVQRGAGQLKPLIEKLQDAVQGLSELDLTDAQQGMLYGLDNEVQERAAQLESLDSLTRSDREYEIETWLDGHNVSNAWEMAPALVSMGFTEQRLSELFELFSQEVFGIVTAWLSARYAVYSLLEEVEQGSKQISQIVKALKSYAYLDQAPVQMIDVHEGLDNTLVMLRSKLKGGVSVNRAYAEDLPRIQAYGSELNQVWTNLIDNAVDAMDGKGEIRIHTRSEGEWVVVEILDTGSGIPQEIQSKIFDPFFTTKEQGKGTGLGLDISYKIVVQRHMGDIRVTSQPGKTCFEVWLPVNFDDVESGKVSVPGMDRMDDERKIQIYKDSKNIAVVGMSTKPTRPAHSVPAFLQEKGYRIIPVRPGVDEILGEKAYPDLMSIPDPVDVVLIFRRSEEVPLIVEQAIATGAKVIWMQQGIVNESAAASARDAGLDVVMDTCMRVEHRRLFSDI
jgi:signal transduction histidine kinase/predicted CoA-binding protein